MPEMFLIIYEVCCYQPRTMSYKVRIFGVSGVGEDGVECRLWSNNYSNQRGMKSAPEHLPDNLARLQWSPVNPRHLSCPEHLMLSRPCTAGVNK